MMTVWIFRGVGVSVLGNVAPGADATPPAGAGAPLGAGGHMDGADEAGAVSACSGAGDAGAAAGGKAAPCAELGTPA